MMTAFDWLWELNIACCGLWSNEKPKEKASNSELRRWFTKGCIKINGSIMTDSTMPVPVLRELTLFPKNDKKRISFRFAP